MILSKVDSPTPQKSIKIKRSHPRASRFIFIVPGSAPPGVEPSSTFYKLAGYYRSGGIMAPAGERPASQPACMHLDEMKSNIDALGSMKNKEKSFSFFSGLVGEA